MMEARTRQLNRSAPHRRPVEEGVCKTFFLDEKKCAAVEKRMPGSDVVEGIADVFDVLASPTRVRIAFALSLEELCVCDLARIIKRSMPATSQQLRLLRKMQVVTYRMDGKLAYYRLTSPWVRHLVQSAVRRTNGKADR